MNRDVSLFQDGTICRTCCLLTGAANQINHASTVDIYIHTHNECSLIMLTE